MFLINFNQWKCARVGINNLVILLCARYKCNHDRVVFDYIFFPYQNTSFVLSNISFKQSCRLWDNSENCSTVGQATDDNLIWRIACWITKPTNTHSGFVILFAFPLQQRLRESVSVSRYTCIACIVDMRCFSPFPVAFRTDKL